MSFYSVRNVFQNVFSELESRFERVSGPGVIVKTGFKKFDELAGGLKPGELVLVGGWRGVGKSAFCHNIVEYIAVHEGLPVAVFTPEINKEGLVQRIISAMTGISIRRLTSGTFEPFKWGRITEAIGELYDAPIYIDDTQYLSIEGITKAVKELVTMYAVRLIIVDHLRYIQANEDAIKNKDILQALRNLARTYQVPLIATVDLCDAITRDRPGLSDLRTAGVCEEDADTIIFIQRSTEGYQGLQGQKAEIIVAKHPQCSQEISFELTFIPSLLRFEREKNPV